MTAKDAGNGFIGKSGSQNDVANQHQDGAMDKQKDLRYGFCGWKPSWLQVFNSGGMYVAFMFLSNVFLSMAVNGLVGVVLSSLETRFEMSSNQSSWIASAYEIAGIPLMPLVSLFGHRCHRPRVTAIGLMTMVIGCLLFVIPHFTTGVYAPGSGVIDHGVCLTEENSYNGSISRDCSDGHESGMLSTYLAVFIIARVLQGLGTIPLQTVGVTFLDDIVTKQKFSLYVAIYFSGGVLGPAIGYIVGGYMLQLFTDFPTVNTSEIGLTTSDPRWVGAWWVGFLFGGIILLVLTLPFFGYCDDLPGAAAIRMTHESEAHGEEGKDTVNDNLANISWGEMSHMIKQVMTNPCFIFLTLFCITDAFVITGFASFGPKYVEQQFSVSSSLAGGLFGLIAIPGGVGGTIAGGLIINRFNLNVTQIMKLELLLSFILVGSGFCFFITCDAVDFAGVSTNYYNISLEMPSLSAPCNANCSCENVPFNPVCGTDNILYFSACHASCHHFDSVPAKEFGNCSCISSEMSLDKMATQTTCSRPDCTVMPLFVVLFFIGMFIIFFNSGMNGTVTLRIVSKDTRALALGLQGLVTRLIGTFPGPLAFGAAFDGACLLWQETCSGGIGSCLHYDNQKMSLYLFLVSIGVKVVSIFFMIMAWKMYRAPKVAAPVEITKNVRNGSVMDGSSHTVRNGSPNCAVMNGSPDVVGVDSPYVVGVDSPTFVRDNYQQLESIRSPSNTHVIQTQL